MAKNRDNYDTTHHQLPTSRGGSNEPCNKLILPNWEHSKLHAFLENAVFSEQLFKLLEYNKTALNPKATQELFKLLNIIAPEERYKEEALRTKYILPRKY
jgi:hypothetical protein